MVTGSKEDTDCWLRCHYI